MVNRVLAQRYDLFTDGDNKSSLRTVVTHAGAYSPLKRNAQTTGATLSRGASESNWLNAVTLAVKITDILDRYYPRSDPYPHSERVRIRNEVSAAIGYDPTNGARFFVAKRVYDNDKKTENGKKYIYSTDYEHQIYNIKTIEGHVFYDYVYEMEHDVGL